MLQCIMQLAVLYTVPLYFRGVTSSKVVRYSFKVQPTLKPIDSVSTLQFLERNWETSVRNFLIISKFEPRAFPESNVNKGF